MGHLADLIVLGHRVRRRLVELAASCSHHIDDLTFAEIVQSAAMDAGCQVSVVEQRTQARDHPVLLGVPETRYLKCLILRKLG